MITMIIHQGMGLITCYTDVQGTDTFLGHVGVDWEKGGWWAEAYPSPKGKRSCRSRISALAYLVRVEQRLPPTTARGELREHILIAWAEHYSDEDLVEGWFHWTEAQAKDLLEYLALGAPLVFVQTSKGLRPEVLI